MKQYCKYYTLLDTYNQNKYQLSNGVIELFQKYIDEDLISDFVDHLRPHNEFSTYIEHWEAP